MRTSGVHRVIEAQAVLNGDTPAIVDATRSLSYRELNRRANAVARCLIAHGFRRGAVATVNMPGGPELAIVCLAVLKAGGAYYWRHEDGLWPQGVSFLQNDASDPERYVAVDVSPALTDTMQHSPNLPIVTRETDLACVMEDAEGQPSVLVPHSTLTALCDDGARRGVFECSDAAALDVWPALMSGGAVTFSPHTALSAA
jgi:non-ribosomal peptide synthetase component F